MEINATQQNGKLLASAIERRNGHNVYTMTGQGEKQGTSIYFTEAITVFDEKGTGYVVAVVGKGIDTRTDPDATKFIASFKILAPQQPVLPSPAVSQPTTTTPQSGGRGVPNAYETSYLAGQIAGACLLIAIIAWVVRRFTQTQEAPRRRRDRDEDDDDDEDDEDDDDERKPRDRRSRR